MSIFALLIIINFKFRVNRTKKVTKKDRIPLLYLIPEHVEHSKKYVDELEYVAYKSMISIESKNLRSMNYQENQLNRPARERTRRNILNSRIRTVTKKNNNLSRNEFRGFGRSNIKQKSDNESGTLRRPTQRFKDFKQTKVD